MSETVAVQERGPIGFLEVGRIVFGQYPRRSILGLALFVGQAFLYNAVFFTYALVLTTFYKVNAASVGFYLVRVRDRQLCRPTASRPFVRHHWQTLDDRRTYLLSGAMLGVTAALFNAGTLSATTQTIAWVVVFFFASAGASAAYLTVSEVFPMETRALAIAFFYAIGTGLGGIIGPVLFGALIASNKASHVAVGYVIGGSLMLASGLVEVFIGVDAEQMSLEEIAAPVSAAESDGARSKADDLSHDEPGQADSPARTPNRTTGTPPRPGPPLPAVERAPGCPVQCGRQSRRPQASPHRPLPTRRGGEDCCRHTGDSRTGELCRDRRADPRSLLGTRTTAERAPRGCVLRADTPRRTRPVRR